MVFVKGGTDAIADQGQGLEVKIGAAGGVVNLTVGADKTGLIDLLWGIGGFKVAKAVVSAPTSDGLGGTLPSLGVSGSIDFANTPLGTLAVAQLQIGSNTKGN